MYSSHSSTTTQGRVHINLTRNIVNNNQNFLPYKTQHGLEDECEQETNINTGDWSDAGQQVQRLMIICPGLLDIITSLTVSTKPGDFKHEDKKIQRR